MGRWKKRLLIGVGAIIGAFFLCVVILLLLPSSDDGDKPDGQVAELSGPAAATRTPKPSRTSRPTRTRRPTRTPKPSRTRRPSRTPKPTKTPKPTRTPTLTPEPTATLSFEASLSQAVEKNKPTGADKAEFEYSPPVGELGSMIAARYTMGSLLTVKLGLKDCARSYMKTAEQLYALDETLDMLNAVYVAGGTDAYGREVDLNLLRRVILTRDKTTYHDPLLVWR